ncbi:hypothetical protein D3C72_529260 [compost metagenome]
MTHIAHDAGTPVPMQADTLVDALAQAAVPLGTAWCWDALAASATLVITPKGQPDPYDHHRPAAYHDWKLRQQEGGTSVSV